MDTPNETVKINRMLLIIGSSVAGLAILTLIVALILLSRDRDEPQDLNSQQSQNNSIQQNNQATKDNQGQPQDNSDLSLTEQGVRNWQKGCVGDEKVMMENLPMNFNDVGSIIPMGLVVGGHVTPIDHLYFSPIIFNSPRDQYPVYAMADGYIIEVGVRRQVVGTGEERPPEYRVIMQHSCQTISYFDLVTSLDDEILAQIPELASRDNAGGIRVSIEAGQEIGRIGGQTLDTAIYNMDLELVGFTSPELYEAEFWKIHTDDFYSYFPDDLVVQMNELNLRQEEPRSGKIDWDQPGKLIGNWFEEGTNGYAGLGGGTGYQAYWSGHLHIGYDAIKPSNIWVSIGDYAGEATRFYVKGNSPDPADVGVESGIIEYELIESANFMNKSQVLNYQRSEGAVKGVILLQVLEGEKLKVEIFPNTPGTSVSGFTENAVMYER